MLLPSSGEMVVLRVKKVIAGTVPFVTFMMLSGIFLMAAVGVGITANFHHMS
jgi:hypothetical protein